MADIATIGIRVDASELERLIPTLDKLTGGTSRFDVQVQQLERRMTQVGQVANRTNAQFSRFGQVVQQSGYQFGDFIVQVQSGTNAWVAAGQQATQMAGLLLTYTNPLILALGAVLSVTIPLATAFGAYYSRTSEANEKTKELKTSIEELHAVTLGLEKTVTAFRFGIDEEEVRSVLEVNNAVAELIRLEQEKQALYNGRAVLFDEEEQARATELNQQISIAREVERSQTAELDAYRKARSEVEALRTAEAARKQNLEDSRERLVKLVELQRLIKEKFDEGTISAKTLASIDFSNINTASAYAIQLASNLGIALGTAQALANLGPQGIGGNDPSGGTYSGRGRGPTDGELAEMRATGVRGLGVSSIIPKIGSSGGGGGGGSNPIESELESLRSYLQSEAEVELEAYQQKQDTLRAALEQRMITLEEFNSLEKELKIKHNEEMEQIDAYRYGNGLAVTTQWFSDMASAMQSGGEKMARVGRVFNAAIALQNSYVAFTEVLRDPAFIGRPLARAAAASVILAQGLSAVAAIRGGGSGGGGGSRGSVGRVQSTAAPSPQTVYVSGLAPDALFTGEMLSNLFESFYHENDNRGKVFVVAR